MGMYRKALRTLGCNLIISDNTINDRRVKKVRIPTKIIGYQIEVNSFRSINQQESLQEQRLVNQAYMENLP